MSEVGFRALAATLEQLDRDTYRELGADPLQPVIGGGSADAAIALFGRDPGREEVRHQLPFVGAAGQKIRAAAYHHIHQREMAGFADSLTMGEHFFWANTVPYKPIGNRAWSMAVKKEFHPLVADLLLRHWRGEAVITLGREAFFWFGIGQSRSDRAELERFWTSPDRFSNNIPVQLQGEEGRVRQLRLYPLPHPSPLNALWYRRFPQLFAARLQQLWPQG
ncbi:MAG: uracil-DNA glycosylase [Gammaproteobacteria bacterium]|nr:uracil-DNA glycosylase [Gammaproteobacteria bacterium]